MGVAKEACGTAKLCKSVDGDAWWNNKGKLAILRKKEVQLDYKNRKIMKKYGCFVNATKTLVKEKRASDCLKAKVVSDSVTMIIHLAITLQEVVQAIKRIKVMVPLCRTLFGSSC